MYKCNNCESQFEYPAEKNICFEEYYGVSTLMQGRTFTNVNICPSCGDDDIEELSKCDMCGEWVNEEDLHDTEGMLNGNVGWCCDQCLEDYDIGG